MGKVTAKVDRGTFSADKWQEIKEIVQQHEGTVLQITFATDDGTDPQNRYWWSTVIPYLADAMGEVDKESVHETILMHLWPEECKRIKNTITGQTMIKRPSWAKMGKAKRGETIEKAIIFAANFYGVAIPEAE